MTTATTQSLPTSDQIRVMARDMFCQDGYKGVGMRKLAAAVGIRAGSLYNHIDSKQALLSELITEYELNLLHVFKCRSISRASTPLQMVALLWEKVERYVQENSKLAQLVLTEDANLTAMQAKRIVIIRRKRVRELHRLLSAMPEIRLSEEGLQDVAEELYTLVDCNAKLIIELDAQRNVFVRRQLRDMASMLMIKRD